MEEELAKYKNLYEIASEENEALKKQFQEIEIFYENRIKEIQGKQEKKHNIVYRALRKIHRKVVKR